MGNDREPCIQTSYFSTLNLDKHISQVVFLPCCRLAFLKTPATSARSPFSMSAPNVTVFLALSTAAGLFFFFFLPDEPACLPPVLGGVWNDSELGSGTTTEEAAPAGDVGDAAPPSREDLFFFFFFFFSADESRAAASCGWEARAPRAWLKRRLSLAYRRMYGIIHLQIQRRDHMKAAPVTRWDKEGPRVRCASRFGRFLRRTDLHCLLYFYTRWEIIHEGDYYDLVVLQAPIRPVVRDNFTPNQKGRREHMIDTTFFCAYVHYNTSLTAF